MPDIIRVHGSTGVHAPITLTAEQRQLLEHAVFSFDFLLPRTGDFYFADLHKAIVKSYELTDPQVKAVADLLASL